MLVTRAIITHTPSCSFFLLGIWNKECRDEKHHVFASTARYLHSCLRKQLSGYFIILYVKIPEFLIIFFFFTTFISLLWLYIIDIIIIWRIPKSSFLRDSQRTHGNTWNAERWNVKLDYDKILYILTFNVKVNRFAITYISLSIVRISRSRNPYRNS